MAAKVKHEVDELPGFESSSIWSGLRLTTKQSPRSLPHVYERSVAALRFLQQIGNPHVRYEEDRGLIKVAYLRATPSH